MSIDTHSCPVDVDVDDDVDDDDVISSCCRLFSLDIKTQHYINRVDLLLRRIKLII